MSSPPMLCTIYCRGVRLAVIDDITSIISCPKACWLQPEPCPFRFLKIS
ncbi:hypothetical protein ACFVHM_31845 [Priestia megaterium]